MSDSHGGGTVILITDVMRHYDQDMNSEEDIEKEDGSYMEEDWTTLVTAP